MRILIAGGTGFLGGACTRQAVAAGHAVTVLTRSGRNVAPGADAVIADRCKPLPSLRGRFDAVIDTKAYQPAMVDHLTTALHDPRPYVYASSVSAYDRLPLAGMDETAPATPASAAVIAASSALPPEKWCDIAALGGANYGPLKAACEARVTDWSRAAAILRLGLICGPGDRTDRFTWWVRRADQGGAIPVPGPRDRMVQVIDVEDAAAFALHLATTGGSGLYNVTGGPLPFAQMVETLITASGSQARAVPVPESAIAVADVACWTDYPLVVPADSPMRGMMQVATARATAAGLHIRPLRDTAARVLDWDRKNRDRPLTAGLRKAQEAALLAAADPL